MVVMVSVVLCCVCTCLCPIPFLLPAMPAVLVLIGPGVWMNTFLAEIGLVTHAQTCHVTENWCKDCGGLMCTV
jgi:hypothetical protein